MLSYKNCDVLHGKLQRELTFSVYNFTLILTVLRGPEASASALPD